MTHIGLGKDTRQHEQVGERNSAGMGNSAKTEETLKTERREILNLLSKQGVSQLEADQKAAALGGDRGKLASLLKAQAGNLKQLEFIQTIVSGIDPSREDAIRSTLGMLQRTAKGIETHPRLLSSSASEALAFLGIEKVDEALTTDSVQKAKLNCKEALSTIKKKSHEAQQDLYITRLALNQEGYISSNKGDVKDPSKEPPQIVIAESLEQKEKKAAAAEPGKVHERQRSVDAAQNSKFKPAPRHGHGRRGNHDDDSSATPVDVALEKEIVTAVDAPKPFVKVAAT